MPDPTKPTPTPQHLGGQAVVKKYGSDHMSKIGKRGYETTVARYFGGDRQAANEWLARRGHYVCDTGYRRLGLGKFKDPGVHPCQNAIADGPWCAWPPITEFPLIDETPSNERTS